LPSLPWSFSLMVKNIIKLKRNRQRKIMLSCRHLMDKLKTACSNLKMVMSFVCVKQVHFLWDSNGIRQMRTLTIGLDWDIIT